MVTEMIAKIERMRSELQIARAQVMQLQRKCPVDVKALRRTAAFHCHPDRGGNLQLMQDLNVLFDFVGGN